MESEIKVFEKAQKVTNEVTDFLNGFRSKELNTAFCEAMDCEHRTLLACV